MLREIPNIVRATYQRSYHTIQNGEFVAQHWYRVAQTGLEKLLVIAHDKKCDKYQCKGQKTPHWNASRTSYRSLVTSQMALRHVTPRNVLVRSVKCPHSDHQASFVAHSLQDCGELQERRLCPQVTN